MSNSIGLLEHIAIGEPMSLVRSLSSGEIRRTAIHARTRLRTRIHSQVDSESGSLALSALTRQIQGFVSYHFGSDKGRCRRSTRRFSRAGMDAIEPPDLGWRKWWAVGDPSQPCAPGYTETEMTSVDRGAEKAETSVDT